MTAILRNLPFFEQESTIRFRDRAVRVKADQIIVWISIAEKGTTKLHSQTPRIPAIFDTGCNHNLVIHERHLREWAGIHPASLKRFAPTSQNGRQLAQLAANVWLHPNHPGHRDEFSGEAAFRLELPSGIAMMPEEQGPEWPRLPLLGMRGLRRAKLHVMIDCEHGRLSARTPRRFWLFM